MACYGMSLQLLHHFINFSVKNYFVITASSLNCINDKIITILLLLYYIDRRSNITLPMPDQFVQCVRSTPLNRSICNYNEVKLNSHDIMSLYWLLYYWLTYALVSHPPVSPAQTHQIIFVWILLVEYVHPEFDIEKVKAEHLSVLYLIMLTSNIGYHRFHISDAIKKKKYIEEKDWEAFITQQKNYFQFNNNTHSTKVRVELSVPTIYEILNQIKRNRVCDEVI